MPSFSIGREAQYSARVSAEDYDWVTQWLWSFKRSDPRKLYAVYPRRTAQINGVKTTLLLAHVILIHRMGLVRPGPEYDADHDDGDTLNNERENLSWLHRSINRNRPSWRR